MQMYWIVILDSVVTALAVLTVLFLILSVVVIHYISDTHDYEPWPLFAICGGMTLLMAMLWTFTPTTKQMAAIVVVPKLVNSEKVQDVGEKLYGLAVEWMDELKPKKKEEK
jgi:hypothetical protein